MILFFGSKFESVVLCDFVFLLASLRAAWFSVTLFFGSKFEQRGFLYFVFFFGGKF